MNTKPWYRDNLIWTSIAVSVFSCAFDGAFLSGLMWQSLPILAVVFGQGLNFAADVATHVLSRQFAEEQQKARRKSKRWRLSFLLLGGDAIAIYYSVVFSWHQIATTAPDLPAWLQWSAASFAPVTILWLGIAGAIRDARSEAEPKREQSETSEHKPAASEPAPLTLGFHCERCEFVAETQNGLNAHKRVHAVKAGNGRHKQPIRTEVSE